MPSLEFNDEEAAEFQCDVVGGWTPCTSPQRFKLKPGKYRFGVRAVDQFKERDPSPVTYKFRVK
jgi:hypothetical protein